MSKICPECGENNNDNDTECAYCGSPLGSANVSNDGDSDTEQGMVSTCHASALTLFEIRKKVTVDIVGDVTIDRERSDVMPEFFITDRYVSSPHCRIYPDGSKWKLQDLGSKNHTSLNGIKLAPFMDVDIKDGCIIKMADLIFKASIINVNSEADAGQNPDTADIPSPDTTTAEKRWVVTCPVCGHSYPVEDENGKIALCKFCDDEFDQQEISHEKAHPA